MKNLKIRVFVMLLSPLLMLRDAAGQGNTEQILKMHHDPKAYVAMLESPERTAEQKPDEVIAALGLKQGEILADIGAGSGFFAFRFAPHVGNNGRIYAVDVNPDMILYMNRYIRDKGVKNVVTVLCTPDDPLLPDASIDRFFICNTWHHIPGQSQYAALMKKMLRPGGRVVVLDYRKEPLPVGPPPEMKVAREETIGHMESAGFKLHTEHTFLPYQYFLVFTLP
jgi:ubiquinone/menaquinone biosynthesis C-methylase UbiE